MMNMKRAHCAAAACRALAAAMALVLALSFLMTLGAMPAWGALAEEAESPVSGTATFHIDLRRNSFFAKYSVDVYLDDEILATLQQGDLMTFSARMSEGIHVLRFVSCKDGSIARTWSLGDIPGETVIACTLQTHRKYIEVIDPQIITSTGVEVTARAEQSAESKDQSMGKELLVSIALKLVDYLLK